MAAIHIRPELSIGGGYGTVGAYGTSWNWGRVGIWIKRLQVGMWGVLQDGASRHAHGVNGTQPSFLGS